MDFSYPIGKYEPKPFSNELKIERLESIKQLPNLLDLAVKDLNQSQLDTPYREGGWSLTQVVHHVADSHINAYTRFKLGLTEDSPTIKPYEEKKWALLPDNNSVPISVSIELLKALHFRLYSIVSTIKDSDWEKVVIHPEHNIEMTLWFLLGLYAWHGKHHTAHITSLRERNNW
jgi:uncharacterized damage-inducible protein DinB